MGGGGLSTVMSEMGSGGGAGTVIHGDVTAAGVWRAGTVIHGDDTDPTNP